MSSIRHIDMLRAPITVTYGTCETPEFQSQAGDFAAAVKAAGKPVELIEAPNSSRFEMCESLGNPFGPNDLAALKSMKLARETRPRNGMAVFAPGKRTLRRGFDPARQMAIVGSELADEGRRSMKANWYYIENEETAGPATLEDLARRIRHTGQSPLVWTEGMAEWTDAEAVPALSQLFRTTSRPSPAALERPIATDPVIDKQGTPLAHRLWHELSEYFMVSVYLFVCFGALLFYKAAILQSDGIEFAPFGIAIVKALVVGKFVLILHALKIGERKGGARVLFADIFKKSALFLIFLGALTVVEEIIVGLLHGRSVIDAISEIGGGTLQQALATSMLMLLILVPYFTFRVVAVRLGEGVLWKLLTERAPAVSP